MPDDTDAGISPYDDSCVIDEQHGIFADATRGDDGTADGSRDLPFKSLGAAIRAAVNASKHVYACTGVYEEPMLIGTAISNGLEVFGGLSCDTFLADPGGAHSLVRAKGKGAALAIADTREVVIERFDFENVPADSAAGTTYVGGFIQNAQKITLRDVRFRAAPGESAADGVAPAGPASSGVPGNPGANACAQNPNPGGAAASTAGCSAQATSTAGGSGGDGAIGSGNGGNGTWRGFQGGLGDTGSGWSCTAGSGLGQGPSPSYGDQPGSGAKGFGALVGTGFVGFSGQAGVDGQPGFGGAGGGGARAPASCPGLAMPTGASAGGGGSGGCGGKGGKPGGPGGSSFGLITVDSDVLMEAGAIAVGNGGRGGRGAAGQRGGKGGPGARGGTGVAGSVAACDGTAGGDAGNGGPGGGGNGGHSIGVLYAGKWPKLIGVRGEADIAANHGGEQGLGPADADPMQAMQLTGTAGVVAFTYAM
jgi:hypothetical protein